MLVNDRADRDAASKDLARNRLRDEQPVDQGSRGGSLFSHIRLQCNQF